jgi:mRNA interferase RelE/StbE
MTWCGILAWTIELHPEAAKQLRSLARRDKPTAKRITNYLTDIGQADDPRSRGRALTGTLAGLWRYRVGDWRIIVDVHDNAMIIVALDINHRSQIYR